LLPLASFKMLLGLFFVQLAPAGGLYLAFAVQPFSFIPFLLHHQPARPPGRDLSACFASPLLGGMVGRKLILDTKRAHIHSFSTKVVYGGLAHLL
jgi:hypothetical protein